MAATNLLNLPSDSPNAQPTITEPSGLPIVASIHPQEDPRLVPKASKKHKRNLASLIDDEADIGSDDDDDVEGAPRRRIRPSESDDEEDDGLDANLNDPNFVVWQNTAVDDDDDDVNVISSRRRKHKKSREENRMTAVEYDELIDAPAPKEDVERVEAEETEEEPLKDFIEHDVEGLYDEEYAENREDINRLMDMLFPLPPSELAEEDEEKDARSVKSIDPFKAAEQLLTPFDDELRNTDIPERIIVSASKSSRRSHQMSATLDQDDDNELKAQAAWITDKIIEPETLGRAVTYESINMTQKCVANVLLALGTHEIVHLTVYQQDIYKPYLQDKTLWTIAELSVEWCEMIALRSRILASLDRLWAWCAANETSDVDEERDRIVHDVSAFFKPHDRHLIASCVDAATLRHFEQKLRLLLSHASKAKTGNAPDTRYKAASSMQSSSKALWQLYGRARCQGSIRRFADCFFPPVAEIGLALRSGSSMMVLNVPTPNDLPFNVALSHTGDVIFDFEEVLLAASRLISVELAYDPYIKQQAKALFIRRGTIWTSLTDVGKREISPSHELWGLHALKGKPVIEVMNGLDYAKIMYMKLVKAKQAGLLTVTIAASLASDARGKMIVDYSAFSSILQPLLSNSVNYSKSLDDQQTRQEWSRLRSDIIKAAMAILVPAIRREVEEEMLVEAKKAIGRLVAGAVGIKLKPACMRPSRLGPVCEMDYIQDPLVKVMGLFVSTEPASICAVVVSDTGMPIESMFCSTSSSTLVSELARLLLVHAPDGIVMNATGKAGLFVEREISKLISIPSQVTTIITSTTTTTCELMNIGTRLLNNEKKAAEDCDASGREYQPTTACMDMLDNMSKWRTGGYIKPDLLVIRDDVAVVFARSPRSEVEFPGTSVSLKCAISLCRMAQNPLAEYAYAWTQGCVTSGDEMVFGRELLSMLLHPHQGYLSESTLLSIIQVQLVKAVGLVGVDFNKACTHFHLFGLMWFVPGLGPRKCLALRRIATASARRRLIRRDQLKGQFLSPIVYDNAVGFLKLVSTEGDVELLASTRIHPMMEAWVIDICNSCVANIRDYSLNQLILEIRQNSLECMRITAANVALGALDADRRPLVFDPLGCGVIGDWLDGLDLDKYSLDLLMSEGKMNANLLKLIKNELRVPFYSSRLPIVSASLSDRFDVLTGESDASLFPGARVGCLVTSVRDFSASLVLPDVGISGFIRLSGTNYGNRNLYSKDMKMSDHFKEGQAIHATVLRIIKSNMLPSKWPGELMPWIVEVSLLDADVMEPINKDVLAHYLFDNDGYNEANATKLDKDASSGKCIALTSNFSSYSMPDLTSSLATQVARYTFMQRLEPKFDDGQASRDYDKDLIASQRRVKSLLSNTTSLYRPAVSSSLVAASEQPSSSSSIVSGFGGISVHHPVFKNMTAPQADKYLSSRRIGDAVIRPSSQPGTFSLTWLMLRGIVKHFHIRVKENESGRFEVIKHDGSPISGLYEDVDELLTRFVSPMNMFVNEMTSHVKFLKGRIDEVESKLRTIKRENPLTIPYLFCSDVTNPGYFIICAVPLDKLCKEIVSVGFNGFGYRGNVFASVNDLIEGYKKCHK